MRQSSIEWLMEIDKSRAITIEEWQQAKAMHKDEIENAYWDGGQWIPMTTHQCEAYYNETFNTK
jgi:hypothetical protein